MFFKSKKIISRVKLILGRHSGGIYKRIDHNREILEYLRRDVPDFKEKPWIESKLKSHDEFLCALAKEVTLDDVQFAPTPSDHPGRPFPRPWPGHGEKDLITITSTTAINAQGPSQSWRDHAYPLQQISIQLQGTVHSDRASIIGQLETVLTRLRAGDMKGQDHDDDFGYRFSVVGESQGPSFFDGPAGSKGNHLCKLTSPFGKLTMHTTGVSIAIAVFAAGGSSTLASRR